MLQSQLETTKKSQLSTVGQNSQPSIEDVLKSNIYCNHLLYGHSSNQQIIY